MSASKIRLYLAGLKCLRQSKDVYLAELKGLRQKEDVYLAGLKYLRHISFSTTPSQVTEPF
jgi:hypothetical protein